MPKCPVLNIHNG